MTKDGGREPSKAGSSPIKISDHEVYGLALYSQIQDLGSTLIECKVCKRSWKVRDNHDPDFLVVNWECPNGCNRLN